MNLDDWKKVKLFDVEGSPKLSKNKEYEYAMSQCSDDGWFLEFGVYQARSINYCADLRPQTHFYGFDSFEGLPEDWVMSYKFHKKGHFSLDKLPQVNDNVTLVKGWFDQVLDGWLEQNKTDDSKISWLNMDADLYSSTISVLDTLNDYIVPGTIIRFDELVDWRLENFKPDHQHNKPKSGYATWRKHEWKALTEWIEKYDREVECAWRNWHQSGAVIVRR